MYVFAPNQSVEKYPYSIGELRRDNPQVSFPKNPGSDVLAEYNVFPVADTQQPDFDPNTQRAEWGAPIMDGNVWRHVWNVVALSDEEIATATETKAASVRAERNEKLAASDWTQVSDAPVDQSVWRVYRSALRDITTQYGFPWAVAWPVEPS